jgi:hypothetical protein
MIRHALFPTLVLEDQYRDADKFKPIFLSKLMKYMTVDGYSNEYTGHVNIHHEEAFAPLFGYITGSIEEYLRTLAIDPEIFDINIVKTWMNITKERHTPFHSHEDAHLSFTYYANIPDQLEKPIVFSSTPPHMNDPYYGMIRFNSTEVNKFNAYDTGFAPTEGNLFVFPARLSHHTVGYGNSEFDEGCKSLDDLKQKRVCLAGDVFFTYRKVEAKPTGIQPSSNWRIFRK